MKKSAAIFLCLLPILFLGHAKATAVTIDFVAGLADGNYDLIPYAAYNLQITADSPQEFSKVVKTFEGLGVDNKQLDDNTGGVEQYEYLNFEFLSYDVKLTEVVFGRSRGPKDSFDLLIDGINKDIVSIFGSDKIKTIGYGSDDTWAVDFSSHNFIGALFSLTDGSGQLNGDDYSIKSISFERAYVPEPATLLLLGVGLIGIAGISRKKYIK